MHTLDMLVRLIISLTAIVSSWLNYKNAMIYNVLNTKKYRSFVVFNTTSPVP